MATALGLVDLPVLSYELIKEDPGDKFGFGLSAQRYINTGLYGIETVMPRSIASQVHIKKQFCLISVNNQAVDKLSRNEIMQLLYKSTDKLTITVAHPAVCMIYKEKGLDIRSQKSNVIHINSQDRNTVLQASTANIKQEAPITPTDRGLLEASKAGIVSPSQPFLCQICLQNTPPQDGIILKECLQEFCRSCLIMVIACTEEEQVHCPYVGDYNCHQIILEHEIRQLIPKEVLDRRQNIAEKTMLELADSLGVSDVYHCKTPNCNGKWIFPPENTMYLCQVCKQHNCKKCKTVHRPDAKCNSSPVWVQPELDTSTAAQSPLRDTFQYDFILWEWQDDTEKIWLQYDDEVSDYLEKFYNKGEQSADLVKSTFNLPYVINFQTMEQTRIDTGRTRKVRRINLKDPVTAETFSGSVSKSNSDPPTQQAIMKEIDTPVNIEAVRDEPKKDRRKTDLNFPEEWDPMNNQTYLCPDVTPDTAEYHTIEQKFKQSMGTAIVLNIVRIQNTREWQYYNLKRQHMLEELGEGGINELQLFHGTGADTVESISRNNFDWRYSGKAHGTALGRGTYFATTAATSHHYTKQTKHPTGRNIHNMFVARVLCGRATPGNSNIVAPPPINAASKSGPFYNSCSGAGNPPTVYVIFDKTQCYPSYLIEYSYN